MNFDVSNLLQNNFSKKFMKRALRVILWCGAAVILAGLLTVSAVFARYRLPSGPAIKVEGEVLYKFIDFGGDFRNFVFEPSLATERHGSPTTRSFMWIKKIPKNFGKKIHTT